MHNNFNFKEFSLFSSTFSKNFSFQGLFKDFKEEHEACRNQWGAKGEWTKINSKRNKTKVDGIEKTKLLRTGTGRKNR